MSWWKKHLPGCVGSVLFRTNIAPRADNFSFLEKQGIALSPLEAGPRAHWRLSMRHPVWGDATLACLRNVGAAPDVLIDFDPRLSDDERALAKLGKTPVTVELSPRTDNVLAERKNLLRFLRAVHADDGVVAMDHTAQSFWPRPSLDEELAHDADLDILGIFTMHAVRGENDQGLWMHSHGFKELGFFEMCLLDPSPALARSGSGWDVVRAVGFSIVEGKARIGGDPVTIVQGASPLAFIPSKAFLGEHPGRYPAWSSNLDDEHLDRHGVACDPSRRRLLGLLRARPEPWAFLKSSMDRDLPIQFSDEATELMATRARATWRVLGALRGEFAEFEFPCLAKLRYQTPAGNEHLWFEIHGDAADTVDATLVNEPWNDIGFPKGDRRQHDLSRLTDWIMMTPAGQITPRSLTPARLVRERADDLRQAMRQHHMQG